MDKSIRNETKFRYMGTNVTSNNMVKLHSENASYSPSEILLSFRVLKT
jgi:hypothetical protein